MQAALGNLKLQRVKSYKRCLANYVEGLIAKTFLPSSLNTRLHEKMYRFKILGIQISLRTETKYVAYIIPKRQVCKLLVKIKRYKFLKFTVPILFKFW